MTISPDQSFLAVIFTNTIESYTNSFLVKLDPKDLKIIWSEQSAEIWLTALAISISSNKILAGGNWNSSFYLGDPVPKDKAAFYLSDLNGVW